ncbi:RHTO0S07e08878g1_1 [Rhodotorula toruloides]|uniref:RHTO0S07e08878g1_1 n=2 Tax=Rhodotorula toruloides TaxID=5286 RepID=A0A061AZR7_RHOTO|nr:uncharacterized protein RHTO_03048 [Rhodotorula toruloides NP11]EMS25320.1 hypothetical protein RHTO_03048 [Rhodotorula toruloides NP11]CDR43151.1 RHTO0S07e08878g1_1 [Rhodotorula toruloides]
MDRSSDRDGVPVRSLSCSRGRRRRSLRLRSHSFASSSLDDSLYRAAPVLVARVVALLLPRPPGSLAPAADSSVERSGASQSSPQTRLQRSARFQRTRFRGPTILPLAPAL